MPIGAQKFDNIEFSVSELKKKYDDLIKESILKARPELNILRADDVSMPGSITNDIFTRIMHSRFVIADISLPNPNVFYELGIRHAIRAGTILIKEKNIKFNIFDVSHLRYIEYENTSSGLKDLSNNLEAAFNFIDANPQKADNQFLELASFIKFRYPEFIDYEEERRKRNQALLNLLLPLVKNPKFMNIAFDPNLSQEEKNVKFIEFFSGDVNILTEILSGLISSGLIQLPT